MIPPSAAVASDHWLTGIRKTLNTAERDIDQDQQEFHQRAPVQMLLSSSATRRRKSSSSLALAAASTVSADLCDIPSRARAGTPSPRSTGTATARAG